MTRILKAVAAAAIVAWGATLADNRTFQRGGSRLFIFDRTGKY